MDFYNYRLQEPSELYKQQRQPKVIITKQRNTQTTRNLTINQLKLDTLEFTKI